MIKLAREEKAKQKKLTQKIMMCCIVSYLIMVIAISAIISIWYYFETIDIYRAEAYSYTKIAANYITSDMIEKYSSTQTKDAEYYELKQNLVRIKEDSGVRYIYVFKVVEDYGMSYFVMAESEKYDVPLWYTEPRPERTLKLLEEATSGSEEELYVTYSKDYGLLGSSMIPILDEKGEVVAIVAIDIQLKQVFGELAFIFAMVCIVVLIVALVCIYYFYRKSTKEIVNPINTVNSAAKNMLENINSDEQLTIECNTGDEIEDLAHSFEKMAEEVKLYIKENAKMARDKERIETELNVATRIQASMLPVDLPNNEYYAIAASMTPAKEVGGDFYDFFAIDESHVGIVMADVSGKGVPAALFMVNAKALIKDTIVKESDLGKVFEHVNEALSENNTEFLFVTAFLGVLDLKTGKFTYVNAGHEPLYVKRANGKFEMVKLKPAVALALMPKTKYEEESMMLEPGDRIFQYTDGITEATNEAGDFFEFERLAESLNKHADSSTNGLLEDVRADVNSFVGEAEQADDITMICLDYKGKR